MIRSILLAIMLASPSGVVVPVNFAPQLVIPVAGSGAGGAGTETEVTIQGHGGLTSEDFVAAILGAQGLGSILVSGVSDSGAIDGGAQLYATSRIWTPQPGSTGFTSQSLDAVPLSTYATSGGSIYGLRRDTRYRANVGIVNLDAAATVTFTVTVPRTTEVHSLTIPPMSMQQVALVSSSQALSQINIGTGGVNTVWVAYGSSIDNVTGDSWSELALKPIPPGSSTERDR